MSEFARNLLTEQRKRMVGSLMGYLEREVYPRLTVPQQRALRDKVLASTAPYHDACLDMLKASVNDGSVVNDEALRLLHQLNDRLARDRRRADVEFES